MELLHRPIKCEVVSAAPVTFDFDERLFWIPVTCGGTGQEDLPYNSVNGSTSITSAVPLHLLSRANVCARRNVAFSAVRLAALIRN